MFQDKLNAPEHLLLLFNHDLNLKVHSFGRLHYLISGLVLKNHHRPNAKEMLGASD